MNRRYSTYITSCLLSAIIMSTHGSAQAETDPPAASAVTETVSADDCERDARQRARDGELDGAQSLLVSCLLQFPDHPQLLARLTLVRLAKDDLDGALKACEGALNAGLTGANRRKIRNICRDLQVVRTTRLRIEANTPAKIYVDSKSYGPRCQAATVCEIGRYPSRRTRIYIEAEGFEPIDERVAVLKKRTNRAVRELLEEESVLMLTVEPEDATVEIDGKVYEPGQIPRKVSAGTHSIVGDRDGFLPGEQTFEARRGKPVTLTIQLARLVPVEVTPADAELVLDGKTVALQDGKLAMSSGGAHALVARRAGYETFQQIIPAGFPDDYQVQVKMQLVEVVPEPDPPVPEPEPETDDVAKEPSKVPVGVWVAAGASVGVLATSGGLVLSARRLWADAAEWLKADAMAGEYSEEGLALRDRARARTAQADYALAASTATALGTLVWLNAGGDKPVVRNVSMASAGAVAALGLSVGGVYAWHSSRARADARGWADSGADDTLLQVLDTRASDMTRRAVLGFGVAGAAAATAAYLWWAKPAKDSDKAAILPLFGDGHLGIAAAGRF